MSKIIRDIRKCMKDRGIRQKDLAKKMGCNEVSISRWINGVRDPKSADLERLAKALGMEIALVFRR